MSGFQTDVLTGLAETVAEAGLATWRPTGVYSATETAIVLGTIPQTPDRVVTLTAYGVSDDPSLSDSVVGVQTRCRWGGQDPRSVNDLDDRLFSLLHGRMAWTLSTGIHVVQCLRASGPLPLGQDENGRWALSSNYYLTVHRPSTYRI